MGGEPRPRRACVSGASGARAACAPSAFAPPAPETRLPPLRPSSRRASRANMGQEEELLRIDHRCHLQPSVLNPEMAVAPAQSRWASVDQWKSRVLPRGLFLPSSPTTEARPSGKGRGCGWSWELQPSLKAWGSHSGDLPAMYPGAESDTFSRFKIYPEHQRSTSRRPDLWKQVHLAFQSQAGCEEGLSWV